VISQSPSACNRAGIAVRATQQMAATNVLIIVQRPIVRGSRFEWLYSCELNGNES
jgi:hypothetical protein